MNRLLKFSQLLIAVLVAYHPVCQILSKAPESLTDSTKIILEIELPQGFKSHKLPNLANTSEIQAEAVPFDYIDVYPGWDIVTAKIKDRKVKFTFHSDKPLLIRLGIWDFSKLLSPRDSVYVNLSDNHIGGRGASEFELQFELEKVSNIQKPTKNFLSINSLDNYYGWLKYSDDCLNFVTQLLEAYKAKIPMPVYDYLKAAYVGTIEDDRCKAFFGLTNYAIKQEKAGIAAIDLGKIWDSTQSNTSYGRWLRSLSRYYGSIYYYYNFTRLTVRRKFNFDFTKDPLLSAEERTKLYYTFSKEQYKGLARERVLQLILSEDIIKETNPSSKLSQSFLADYYSLPGFPEYKHWMRSYHSKTLALKPGKRAPGFVLTDQSGKEFTVSNLKGKISLIDFWFSGCVGCSKMTPALREIEEAFSKDSNIVFVSVSVDKDKGQWARSIKQAKYTTGNGINLYTGGQSDVHPMIKSYNISNYPELILIDAEGKIVANPVPDPRTNTGMTDLLKLMKNESTLLSAKQNALVNDGPYVWYSDKSINAYTIVNNAIKQIDRNTLKVQSDVPDKTFLVEIKKELKPEKAVYTEPDKLFALSDIEGNFRAFRELLQANKIIDKDFNWTFGNGHLVFAGDMFDRGLQVTECLWLVYSLESKAKTAGGYIHFLLGNHEIMNLQGDHRYAHQKYRGNATKMGKQLIDFYNEDSELGRWLRTKNIVEKIGSILFVHGGISPEVTRLPATITDINEMVRPYYGGKIDSSNYNLLTLFNDKRLPGRDKTSPFWFRGYYGDNDNVSHIPTMQQIDSTLEKFNIRHIVTGHTIVADTISIWYNGKVINIDTYHAGGKSEALIAENNQFYRVNAEGYRKKLPITYERRFTITSNTSAGR
jgi:cytochrome oxidase Cu insertion factor (SCO1/SenC/PrrC family)